VEPYRLYLDTEFNSYQGDLISMALVSEDGREFYEVVEFSGPVDPWVAEHVVPKLGIPFVSVPAFQARLEQFLGNLTPGGRDVEIVADWPDDIKYFCAALLTGPGTKIDFGSVLKFALVELPDFSSADESKLPHNALADARALMRYCTDPTYMPGWRMS
jgi:3' exoribonuclease, RNase T-like